MKNKSEIKDISWGYFTFALIGAPLLVTLLTFWAIIPVFALIFGGPYYLLLAPPFLIWMLRRHGPNYLLAVVGACVSLLAIPLLMGAYGVITNQPSLFSDSFGIALFGLIFAPAYAATFIFLYRNSPKVFGPKGAL